MENYILTILGYIFGAGGVLAFFFERRKNKALTGQEEERIEVIKADAIKGMREAYVTWIEDYNKAHAELKEKCIQMDTEISGMKIIVSDNTNKLQSETMKYSVLEKKYNRLKTAYDELKVSYEKLRKQFDEMTKNG